MYVFIALEEKSVKDTWWQLLLTGAWLTFCYCSSLESLDIDKKGLGGRDLWKHDILKNNQD